jgi:hypothetical protein
MHILKLNREYTWRRIFFNQSSRPNLVQSAIESHRYFSLRVNVPILALANAVEPDEMAGDVTTVWILSSSPMNSASARCTSAGGDVADDVEHIEKWHGVR